MRLATSATCSAISFASSPGSGGRTFAGDRCGRPGDVRRQAQKAVAAYHAGQLCSRSTLRVVYFVPSGVEPLTAYAERLDRVMNDVSDFFRDGLRRFGLQSEGLPLERKDGKLVLHVVQGKLPADQYHHSSGDVTAAEIRAALRGNFDLDRQHVLVFYALCRKEPDGADVFDAPYYGGGSERGGLCHAADCEWLDPACSTRRNDGSSTPSTTTLASRSRSPNSTPSI